MSSIDSLFETTNQLAFRKFENQDFENVGKVHDWRNYVPKEFIDNWFELTEYERKIIFILCESRADNEEWD